MDFSKKVTFQLGWKNVEGSLYDEKGGELCSSRDQHVWRLISRINNTMIEKQRNSAGLEQSDWRAAQDGAGFEPFSNSSGKSLKDFKPRVTWFSFQLHFEKVNAVTVHFTSNYWTFTTFQALSLALRDKSNNKIDKEFLTFADFIFYGGWVWR